MMKRTLALLLALLMVLSLVGCGGDSGVGDTADTDTDTSKSGDTVMNSVAEEMLANAELLDFPELENAFVENPNRAKETYAGKTFKIFAIAGKIENEYLEYEEGFIKFRVYLSAEKLKELNQGDGINIVGAIDSIETESVPSPFGVPMEYNIVNIKTAYYVDDVVYGVFKINRFFSDEDKGNYCSANAIQMLNGIGGDPVYRIFLDEEILSTLSEQDFVFVSGSVYREDTFSTKELRNAELIVKGQDEITAYFETLDAESGQK